MAIDRIETVFTGQISETKGQNSGITKISTKALDAQTPSSSSRPIKKAVLIGENNQGCFGGLIAKVKRFFAKYVTLPLLERRLSKNDYSDVNGYFGSLATNSHTILHNQEKLGDALYCIVTSLISQDLINQNKVNKKEANRTNSLHNNYFTAATVQAALNHQLSIKQPIGGLLSQFSTTSTQGVITVSHPITQEPLFEIDNRQKSRTMHFLHEKLTVVPSTTTGEG